MTIPKISIIVPVYNAGPYFKEALESLLHQSLKEIEIILVLDCPTDGSDKIADFYATEYSNIKIIRNSVNMHIGLSRNKGIEAATGEYIGFMDHDDSCTPDMFEKLYLKAKENDADIVISDFYRESLKTTVVNSFPRTGTDEEFREDYFNNLLSGPNHRKKEYGLVWNQIYKRTFLIENNIIFQDNNKITFEDRIFLIEAYFFAKKVVRLPEAHYNHIDRTESEGKSYRFKSVNLVTNYLLFVHHFLSKYNILKEKEIYFSEGTLLTLYSAFRHELRNKSLSKALKEFSKIRKNQIIQESLRNFFTRKNLHLLKKYPLTKLTFLILATTFTRK